MSEFDDELERELHPDNLGSIGEQETAPADPARIAAPTAPVIAPTIAPQPAAQTPYDSPASPGIATRRVTLSPAEKENLDALDANTQARRDTAETEGNAAVDKAVEQAANAQAVADLTEQHAQQQADLAAQQRKIVEERHQRDQEAYARYREMGLKDPDAHQSFGHRLGAALAIGLGQYSAAMNHTQNEAAHIFEQARADNFKVQAANIEKAKEESIRAGQDVKEAQAEASEALHQLQIKQVAQIDAFKAKFQAESERLGIPAARIQATKTVQELDRQAMEAREKHLESTRTFSRDLTPKELRGKGGGAGGGGGSAGAMAQLSQYAIDHPGDQPGLYRLAEQLKIPKADKAVASVINQTKPTEGQAKDARQAAIGLRAVDEIEKSGYVPSKAAIQKWFDNQRKIELTHNKGIVGGGASIVQSLGGLPQSEVEGLTPKAAAYFSNVRRFMETIGRAQSGSAINASEWENFYNQYGPNSSGGMAAARKYLQDQARVSGVAGRQVEAGNANKSSETTPAKTSAPAADPLIAKAQKALSDPNAPPAAKAAAIKYLKAHGGGE